jgi:hypothetical protein
VENVFLISGDQPWTCPTASASGSGTRSSLRRRLPLLPRLVGGRHHLQPRGSPKLHPPSRASTHWSSTQSSATRDSPRC